MKKDQKLFNYTLSIGFILSIVLFIVVMIAISRHVLSDTNGFGDYVYDAQNLLQDVNEVEVSAKEDSDRETIEIDDKDLLRLKFNNYQENIQEVSSVNIDGNKSIISIVLNSKIEKADDVYYLKLKGPEDLSKSYEVVYVVEGELEFGKVFSVNDDEVKLIDVDSKTIVDLDFDDILGKVILEHGEQED